MQLMNYSHLLKEKKLLDIIFED